MWDLSGKAVVTVFCSKWSPGSARIAALENSTKNSHENVRDGVSLLIIVNKTFHKRWFLVIFSNISDQLFERTPPDDYF